MASLSTKIPSLVFILCHVLLYTSPASASGEPYYYICNTTSNYAANSSFHSNLKLLLTSLCANGSVFGFSNGTLGWIPDQVYGLVSCRGDTNATTCGDCLRLAERIALQSCPYNKGAIVWVEHCFLLYSYKQLLPADFPSTLIYFPNPTINAVAPDWFIVLVEGLMGSISNLAASSSRRFATGELKFSAGSITIYGLAQCSGDLSNEQCRQCLKDASEMMARQEGKLGGRVFGVACGIRYEVYPFFYGAPTLMLSSPPAGDGTAAPPLSSDQTPTRERGIATISFSFKF